MDKRIVKISATKSIVFEGDHRFEHWYVDNQVYFIMARCRDKFPAFESEQAKAVFWDRFNHYCKEHQFFPWVTSLMSNHYHVVGYCRIGSGLGQMMRKIHGSVAKLVNDLLPERRVPFWREAGHQDYFDGCLRDEKQCRLAYRYTLTQSVRHGICPDYLDYPHTRVSINVDVGVKRSLELKAFMEGVPYKRYLRKK
jgi:REP element-mobilizing transposase RayT